MIFDLGVLRNGSLNAIFKVPFSALLDYYLQTTVILRFQN